MDSIDIYFKKQDKKFHDGSMKQSNIKLLNLGCGNRFHPDWDNIDFTSNSSLVRAYNLNVGIPYDEESVDVLYHSHLLEHFPKHKAIEFLHECYRVLKSRGIIRVVIPDLEQIARQYIDFLEKSLTGDVEAQKKYEWIMLEMYDQTVRNFSGGEMLKYWQQKEIPAKEFVLERMGTEAKAIINSIRDKSNSNKWDDNEFGPLMIGKFRLSGEIHQWMYDSYSLSNLLSKCSFKNIITCNANESRIPNFNYYLLDVESDGSVRKPDSLFMEAIK